MDGDYLVVVGDRFARFARHPNVVGLSDLPRMLASSSGRRLVLIAGQGVNRHCLERLAATTAGSRRIHRVVPPPDATDMAGLALCHKVFEKNRLVTLPVKIGESQYRLALRIDDANELIQDHQTGQHIPGMVLIEAARQSFLSVTEKFHGQPGHAYSFVISRLDARYFRFLFPLAITIDYRVRQLEVNAHGRIHSTATVEFHQGPNAQPATVCEVGFRAYPRDYLEQKEQAQACDAVAGLLREVGGDENIRPVVNSPS